jgi:hypothetical protein
VEGGLGEPGTAGRVFTPRVVEAAVAVLVAAAMGVGGVAATTTQFAGALLAISGTGLVVLLVTGAVGRRRWTLR